MIFFVFFKAAECWKLSNRKPQEVLGKNIKGDKCKQGKEENK